MSITINALQKGLESSSVLNNIIGSLIMHYKDIRMYFSSGAPVILLSPNLHFRQGSSSLQVTHQYGTSKCAHLMLLELSAALRGQQISRTSDLSIEKDREKICSATE